MSQTACALVIRPYLAFTKGTRILHAILHFDIYLLLLLFIQCCCFTVLHKHFSVQSSRPGLFECVLLRENYRLWHRAHRSNAWTRVCGFVGLQVHRCCTLILNLFNLYSKATLILLCRAGACQTLLHQSCYFFHNFSFSLVELFDFHVQGLSALGNITRLRDLNLTDCAQITDLGLQKFSQQCTELERIDLSYCYVSKLHRIS